MHPDLIKARAEFEERVAERRAVEHPPKLVKPARVLLTDAEKKRRSRESRRRNRERRSELINELKQARGCALCGYNAEAVALDFDHLYPSTKSFAVSVRKMASLDEVMDEIAKCRVLCSNCHRIETLRKGHWNKGR